MALILITGGAGFIGSHTADVLLAEGHRVRILDCLDPQIHGANARVPAYLSRHVEFLKGDVCNPSDVSRAVTDVDAVYHFAALTGVGQSMYNLHSYSHVNVSGTAVLLEGLVKRKRPLQRLVLSSSRAIYGEGAHACPSHGIVQPAPRKREDMLQGRFDVYCPVCGDALAAVATPEEQTPAPISVYAWTKKHQEDLCRHCAGTFGLPVTILRYFNVFGSRQSLKNPYTGVVSIFFNRLRSGESISIYERGVPTRDFVHVSDVVRANLLALTADAAPGTSINVGSGNAHKIAVIAGELGIASGCPARLKDCGEFRVGDIHSCHADLSRAQSLLNYRPRTALREGLAEFVAWASGQESSDHYQRTVDELQECGLFGRAS